MLVPRVMQKVNQSLLLGAEASLTNVYLSRRLKMPTFAKIFMPRWTSQEQGSLLRTSKNSEIKLNGNETNGCWTKVLV